MRFCGSKYKLHILHHFCGVFIVVVSKLQNKHEIDKRFNKSFFLIAKKNSLILKLFTRLIGGLIRVDAYHQENNKQTRN